MENSNLTTTDNGKTAAIISYFTIIGWLIAYFAMHKDNRTAIGGYHLRQTLLFHIVSIILSWGLGFVVGIIIFATGIVALAYLMYIIYLGLFIVWIIGLIGAINNEAKPMPIIGEKAQSMFATI
ncbi:hypothetical protein [Pedobacter namyangjuensis]|uniref:hypothetical protein n=1 Tax=Pedobacter namyangjuensis TaxID=600626 RepID=UPI000DE46A3C|nr:hypothetical protein [Pedobacter namyangjuensis]